jgi:hypothetical protein
VNAKVIPIITETNGTISKSLKKYLSNGPVEQKQGNTKNRPTGLCTHTSETTNVKQYKTYFTCEITLHVAKIVKTELLQHYIP